jgi:hypothetical protein
MSIENFQGLGEKDNIMRLKVNWAEGVTAIGVYNAILSVMLLDVTGL